MESTNYHLLFMFEAQELLQQLGNRLISLEQDAQTFSGTDLERVHDLFRSAHSFKGMAVTMGFESSGALAHAMENLLDAWRSRRLAIQPEALDLLLRAVEHLERMVEEIGLTGTTDVEIAALVAELEASVAHALPYVPSPDVAEPALVLTTTIPQTSGPSRLYAVEVTLDASCMMKSVRALMVVSALEMRGRMLDITPSVEELEWSDDNHGFIVLLESPASAAELEAELEGLAEIERYAVSERTPLLGPVGGPVPEPEAHGSASSPRALAEPEVVQARLSSPPSVRVAAEHLDAVSALLGELATERLQLGALLAEQGPAEAVEALGRLERLSERLEAEVARMRTVNAAVMFERFPRVVRDLARQLGKSVRFEIVGQEAELDRAVADALVDPLLHLLRNALDHGLETPAERLAHGKPETGRLRLEARQEGTTVVLSLEDDGRGLDRAAIAAAAVADGRLSAQEAAGMSDSQVYELIFAPGLTTSGEVTLLSGRGVGLDAVRQSIRSLGGSLEVESAPGRFCRFRLRLPCTSSIVPSWVVAVGDELYGVPTAAVEAVLEGPASEVAPEPVERFCSLRERFGVTGPAPEDATGTLLIVRTPAARIGVLADRLCGRSSLTVKPLSPLLGRLQGFAGAATCEDGRIALVLDVERLP